MSRAVALYQSSLGKKAMMAVTGIIGFGFVIGHMIGNLQAFSFFGGREAINAYGEFLHLPHSRVDLHCTWCFAGCSDHAYRRRVSAYADQPDRQTG